LRESRIKKEQDTETTLGMKGKGLGKEGKTMKTVEDEKRE